MTTRSLGKALALCALAGFTSAIAQTDAPGDTPQVAAPVAAPAFDPQSAPAPAFDPAAVFGNQLSEDVPPSVDGMAGSAAGLPHPSTPAPYRYQPDQTAITAQSRAPQIVAAPPSSVASFSTAFAGDAAGGVGDPDGTFIPPERTVSVPISRRDGNRIHCPVEVTDVFYSKEKPVSVAVAGTDVYVKAQKRLIGGVHEQYDTTPIDLYVVCGDATYTLLLQPQPIAAVTLRLGSPVADKIQGVVKEWGALPIEEKVQRLTRLVYRDELPAGFGKYAMTSDRRQPRLFRNVIVQGVSRVSAPGLGLAALEYQVLAQEPVRLDERDFLNTNLSRQIVGVTIDPLVLNAPGQKARLIIIERSLNDGR